MLSSLASSQEDGPESRALVWSLGTVNPWFGRCQSVSRGAPPHYQRAERGLLENSTRSVQASEDKHHPSVLPKAFSQEP